MREIHYDYLQSAPRSGKTSFGMLKVDFEDVMNLPIKYLNLQGHAKELIVDKPFYIGKTPKKMLTIGDLVNLGYSEVVTRIRSSQLGGHNLMIYSIELALAKFSLKLKGTEFTVFDIDVEDAGLSQIATDWAIKNGLYTLGDFHISARRKLKKLDDNKESREIKKSVIGAMKYFGIISREKKSTDSNDDALFDSQETTSLKMFPEILKAINIERERTAKTKFIGLEIFDNIDYLDTECDYSKMIDLIRLNFTSASDFMSETKISMITLEKIVEGKELQDKTLKKIYGYFHVPITGVVTFKTTTIKRSVNAGVGEKYNFSKVFIKIRNMYGSREHFRKVAGISDSSLDALSKGKLLSYKNMRRICKALRCKLEDIMEVVPQKVEEQENQEEIKTYYDYSKLKELMKKKGLSFNKLLTGSGLNRNYIGQLIGTGKPLNKKYIEILTSLLGCKEEDLYEVKMGDNPYIECDYSKLLKLLESRMISVSQMCKNIGIPNQELLNKISKGKHLGQEKLNKITRYLECQEEDIITIFKSREEVKKQRIKAMKRLEPEIDYTKLFALIENEGITLEELRKKLSMSDLFTNYVNRNVKLAKGHITKLCRYFKCKPEDLFAPYDKTKTIVSSENAHTEAEVSEGGSSPKVIAQGACDYTNLLKIVVQTCKSLQEFTRKVGISRDYVIRINKGEILDYRIYKKIIDFLNKPLDEFVKFINPSDRERVLEKIKEEEDNKNNPEVDYSELYKKLAEKDLTDSDLFRNNIVSFNIVLYKIRQSKEISTDAVKRICKFLECETDEIMRRIKPKKLTAKEHKPERPEVNYSRLIAIVDKRFLNLTQICRDVGIGIHFAHSIKMGKRIGRDKLEKICDYLGCDPDTTVFEIERANKTPNEQPSSFVNTSFGGGTVRVKPAFQNQHENSPDEGVSKVEASFQNSQEEVSPLSPTSETIESNDTPSSKVHGIAPSSKPKDIKFYFTPRGYINRPDIKFRSHKFSPAEELVENPFEPTF